MPFDEHEKLKDGYLGLMIDNPFRITELFTRIHERLPVTHRSKGERHAFYEFFAVLDGSARVTTSRGSHLMQKNQMLIITPGEHHLVFDEEGTAPEVLIFSFGAKKFPSADGIYSLNEEIIAEALKICDDFDRVFVMLSQSDLNKDRSYAKDAKVHVRGIKEGRALSADALVKRLEALILNTVGAGSVGAKGDAVSEQFNRILMVIEENLHLGLNLTKLSALLNVSASYLERIVKQQTGIGVMHYCMLRRMQRALSMLNEGMSVREVSDALGFSNQNYFSERFKRFYGYPPSQARKAKKNAPQKP